MDDDEVLSEAIICDQSHDAEAAQSALSDVWSTVHRIGDEEDGTVSYFVEVKGKGSEPSVRVVDRWAESRN